MLDLGGPSNRLGWAQTWFLYWMVLVLMESFVRLSIRQLQTRTWWGIKIETNWDNGYVIYEQGTPIHILRSQCLDFSYPTSSRWGLQLSTLDWRYISLRSAYNIDYISFLSFTNMIRNEKFFIYLYYSLSNTHMYEHIMEHVSPYSWST